MSALLVMPSAAHAAERAERLQGLAWDQVAKSSIASNLRRAAGLEAIPSGQESTATVDRDEQGRLEVLIEGPEADALESAVAAVGGEVRAAVPGKVAAVVSADRLEALAEQPGVGLIRDRHQFRAADAMHGATTTESLTPTAAAAWQGAATPQLGAGVNVAIIDFGFAGLAEAQATGDLPPTGAGVTSVDFCPTGLFNGTAHGTEVAAIVHDMAPAANLTLICAVDDPSVGQARDYILSHGITVVNGSWVDPIDGRGDGSGGPGTLAGIVRDLRENGVLWVNSAGNYGQRHVSFTPSGRDYVLFPGQGGAELVQLRPGGDYTLAFTAPASCGGASIQLKWDAWPVTALDFDMYILNNPNPLAPNPVVAWSGNEQTGYQAPWEFASVENNTGVDQTFYMVIDRYNASANPRFDAYVECGTNLEFNSPAEGLGEPATSPYVIAVGSTCYSNGALAAYSSRGPTIDGRIKPDLTGPDGTSAQVNSVSGYGPASPFCTSGFLGTSAAAPHVTGAAALIMGANPSLDTSEVEDVLTRSTQAAADPGLAGLDNQYGAGWMKLGSAPPPPPAPPTPAPYTGVAPVRIVDTRAGFASVSHGDQPLGPGEAFSLPVAGKTFGATSVPANATAVVLNVTVVQPTQGGFLTVYPAGQALPTASNLNFTPGEIVPNFVTATIGTGGQVKFFNSSGQTNLVVDLVGWYGPASSSGLNAVTPARAVDTRPGGPPVSHGDQPLGSGETFTVPFRNQTFGGTLIPATATAMVLNVTVAGPSAGTYLTVFPSGTARPNASSLNFVPGQTVANLVTATIGADGAVSFYNDFGQTHLLVDVLGYYRSDGGAGYVALSTPTRDLDTRSGNGFRLGPLGATETYNLDVTNMHGIPFDAEAVLLNVTATQPWAAGWLTIFPQGAPQPNASNLNFAAGQTVPNAVVVSLGAGGNVSINQGSGGNPSTHVISDVQGYFAGTFPANAPEGSVSTYQTNPLHDGHNSGNLTLPLHEKWRHDFGSDIGYPLLVNGKIFIAVTTPDTYGNDLYALDAATGNVLWGPVVVGGTYWFTGLAADSENVYANNFDGEVRAFSQATGDLAWLTQLPEYWADSIPTVRDGVLYIVGSYNVHALRAASGKILWSVAGGNTETSVAVTDDGVYVSPVCAQFKLHRRSGKRAWTYAYPCTGGGGSLPVVHNGFVYMRDWANGDTVLSAVDGSKKASFTADTTPAFDGGLGFFLQGGTLNARNVDTMAVAWSTTGDGHFSTPAVTIGGKLVMGSTTGLLAIYNEQTGGVPLWSTNVGQPITGGTHMPAGLAVADGTLLVPATNVLVAYGP